MGHLAKSSDHTEITIIFMLGLTCIPHLQGDWPENPCQGLSRWLLILNSSEGGSLPKSKIGTGHWFNHIQSHVGHMPEGTVMRL